MNTLEELKVKAYQRMIDAHEETVSAWDDMFVKENNASFGSLREYRRGVVTIVRYRQLIREITGEEVQS